MKIKKLNLNHSIGVVYKKVATVTATALKNLSFLIGNTSTTGDTVSTFKDTSSSNLTVNRAGSVAQGLFSPYGKNWGVYFNGSSYMEYPASAGFGFGTGAFTIECWLNMTAFNTNACEIFDSRTAVGLSATYISISATGIIGFYDGPTGVSTADPVALSLNTWYHIAITRDASGVWRMFKNGVQTGTRTSASNLGTSQPAIVGGARNGAAYGFIGYLSNFRVIKGSALYTANFTPPTTLLTAVSGTTLLTCTSNALADSANIQAAPTMTGAPVVTRYNPFGNAGETIASYGGSAYFNNDSTQSLSVVPANATAFGTGDFTYEYWFYTMKSVKTDVNIFDNRNNSGPSGSLSSGGFYSSSPSGFGATTAGGNMLATVSAINLNQWYHVAVVRKSGVAYFYLNGVFQSSVTDTNNYGASPNPMMIGVRYTSPYLPVYGYISDFRLVKGTAVYTANFTPPTAPLTAISGTTFLLNGANANIYDVVGNSDLANTNVLVSTAKAKFNNTALAFTGSNYLQAYNSNNATGFGTGDFTVESWVYSGITTGAFYLDTRLSANSEAGHWAFGFGINVRFSVCWYTGTGVTIEEASPTAFVANAWNHVAYVRTSGVAALYVNGVLVGSASDTTNYTSSGRITAGNMWSHNLGLNGYLQDVRISNVAQYTGNFTPPTKSFADGGQGTMFTTADPYIGNVRLLLHFDGNYVDASGHHTLTSSGGTSISAGGKFGSASMALSGATGGTTNLSTEATTDFNMGTGDFTFEWWQNATALTADLAIVNKGLVTATNPNRAWIEYFGKNILVKNDGTSSASTLSSNSQMVLGTWQHIAITRQNGLWRAFVDGNLVGSLNLPGSWGSVSGPLVIGSGGNASFSGKIDEFRATAGIARYTASFTPPTAPFANQ